jgi:hypothetical protein
MSAPREFVFDAIDFLDRLFRQLADRHLISTRDRVASPHSRTPRAIGHFEKQPMFRDDLRDLFFLRSRNPEIAQLARSGSTA